MLRRAELRMEIVATFGSFVAAFLFVATSHDASSTSSQIFRTYIQKT